MSRYSLLTIDLNSQTTSEQRDLVYEALKKSKWKRIPELTTLWYAEWKDTVSDEGIITTTKSDVEQAAKSGNVTNYDASVAVCGKPIVWKGGVK